MTAVAPLWCYRERALRLLRICDRRLDCAKRKHQPDHHHLERLAMLPRRRLNPITRASHYAIVDLMIGEAIHEDFGSCKRLHESFVPHGRRLLGCAPNPAHPILHNSGPPQIFHRSVANKFRRRLGTNPADTARALISIFRMVLRQEAPDVPAHAQDRENHESNHYQDSGHFVFPEDTAQHRATGRRVQSRLFPVPCRNWSRIFFGSAPNFLGRLAA